MADLRSFLVFSLLLLFIVVVASYMHHKLHIQMAMSLCHSCVIEKREERENQEDEEEEDEEDEDDEEDEEKQQPTYQGSSPDDVCLVAAAAQFGECVCVCVCISSLTHV